MPHKPLVIDIIVLESGPTAFCIKDLSRGKGLYLILFRSFLLSLSLSSCTSGSLLCPLPFRFWVCLFILMEQRDSCIFTQTLLFLQNVEEDSLPSFPSNRILWVQARGLWAEVTDAISVTTWNTEPLAPSPDPHLLMVTRVKNRPSVCSSSDIRGFFATALRTDSPSDRG